MDDFIEFVEHQAIIQSKRFFPNKYEGRTFFDINTGWNLEDMSGWLFDNSEKDLINHFFGIQGSQEEEKFSEFYYRAIWKMNEDGLILIDFIK